MTLREQIEALRREEPWPQFVTAGNMAEAARIANNNVVDAALNIVEQWVNTDLPKIIEEAIDKSLNQFHSNYDIGYQEGVMDASEAAAEEWGEHICIPNRIDLINILHPLVCKGAYGYDGEPLHTIFRNECYILSDAIIAALGANNAKD